MAILKKINNYFHLASTEETIALGIHLGKQLPKGSVVAFFGDLGAGKTTMIKGIAESAAHIDPRNVCSPTFTYLNIYSGDQEIYHFDLYRLKTEEDFLAMGFEEYFNNDGICCIEWPERIPSLLPQHAFRIEILYSGENTRKVIVQ